MASVDVTEDTILGGAVRILQPTHGYRFSVDSVQLADFALKYTFRRALDLGCGSGVVAFLLAYRAPRAQIVGLELDSDLASLACQGVNSNNFENRVTIVQGDLRQTKRLLPQSSFDLIVANPPYHDPKRGHVSPKPSRARGRHELTCTLRDVFAAARTVATPRARLVLILPVERLPEVVVECHPFRMTALRFVHPREDQPARRVLLELRRSASQTLTILPPLIVHTGHGYSTAMQHMLAGG